jgi:hypothetical protein
VAYSTYPDKVDNAIDDFTCAIKVSALQELAAANLMSLRNVEESRETQGGKAGTFVKIADLRGLSDAAISRAVKNLPPAQRWELGRQAQADANKWTKVGVATGIKINVGGGGFHAGWDPSALNQMSKNRVTADNRIHNIVTQGVKPPAGGVDTEGTAGKYPGIWSVNKTRFGLFPAAEVPALSLKPRTQAQKP